MSRLLLQKSIEATVYVGTSHSSLYELKLPRKGLRRPNTDPESFVFCEFCKRMHMHGNAPQEPEKQVYRNSEVR